jgi:hypothetical protein
MLNDDREFVVIGPTCVHYRAVPENGCVRTWCGLIYERMDPRVFTSREFEACDPDAAYHDRQRGWHKPACGKC